MVPRKQQPSARCTLARLGQDGQRTDSNSFYPRSYADAAFLQNCTPSQQDLILCDLAAAETARAAVVQRGIQSNHNWLWKCWREFYKSTGLGNDYSLKQVPQNQQQHILCAFAVAMCKGRFLLPADAPLVSKTVSGTINHMAAAFRCHGYHNLSQDKHGILDWNLACQL